MEAPAIYKATTSIGPEFTKIVQPLHPLKNLPRSNNCIKGGGAKYGGISYPYHSMGRKKWGKGKEESEENEERGRQRKWLKGRQKKGTEKRLI